MSTLDLLFKNARVLDGTGNPWFRADVGVQGDCIATIGRLDDARAATVIDVAEKFLCPGLIDVHIHTDLNLLTDPQHEASLRQGVTTHILGQDGISFAPASPDTLAYMRAYFAGINTIPNIDWNWSSVREFLARFDQRVAVNVAYLVPHGNLRMEVLGTRPDAPTRDELSQMQELARQAMREGAIGISTGLDYIPCAYAEMDELVALAQAVAPLGGIFVTHTRMNKLGVIQATKEAIAIGRAAKIPTHISHFNGRADELLPLIDAARAEGVDLTYDSYCYLASCTIVAMHALPDWVQEGGQGATMARLREPGVREKLREWIESPARRVDKLQLTYVPGYREEEGLRIPDAARRVGMTVTDYVCARLVDTQMQMCAMAFQEGLRTEADMARMMQHPAHMGGSDGIFSGSRPHPRGYGCFARYLAYHTCERGDWTWGEAIRHLSGHPARRFGLRDRGLIREGMIADIFVFDPEKIKDHATFDDGSRLADGVEYVVVNGKLALRDGRVTGEYAGRVLGNS